ncbi:CBS and ACT domain-containing protein [Thermodesulfobacteriota bacterium]
MLVKCWMSKPVIMIDKEDSMDDAIKLFKEKNIRRLPVVDQKNLVGIVIDRDLRRASASDATSLEIHELLYLISKIKIKDIMTQNPVTVSLNFSLEETSKLLLKNRISGVPVVDEKKNLMGVITQSDLFRVLTTLTGVDNIGIQFAFLIKDRPGSIKKITDIIRNYDGRLLSLLTSFEKAPEGFRNLYVRAYRIDRNRLPRLQEELKREANMIYMLDHRISERSIHSNGSAFTK